ncbi:glutamate--cysteine ligase [Streptomyces sp. NPDC008121]|uniref:carboxylate-amine ligase n=1 Tax=Streptomyces sp. NPDC008121 TaxID=3364809 RepID=UPI0036EAF308
MTVRVGVEEEFHVVDRERGSLVPRADVLLDGLPGGTYTREMARSIVETNSEVHASLEGLHDDLLRTRRGLDAAAARHGLAVIGAGTAPLGRVEAVDVTPDARYRAMADEYRRVADEQLICGAQVHVDVPDRDSAVRALCALGPWLPPLLALSASSPFWLGSDTGYASWRTMLWQRWPTAGPAGCFRDAAEYDGAVAGLIRSGVISDAGMIYYDVRPSAHQGTLELRVCDACPRPETVVMIAGLFRALVTDVLARADRPGYRACDGRHEWLRAATWRAARSGLEAELIDPETRRPAPAARVMGTLLRRLRPALEEYGDWELVRDLVARTVANGSTARRLRAAAAREDLLAAVDLLAAETRGERPARKPARTSPFARAARVLPTAEPRPVRVKSTE